MRRVDAQVRAEPRAAPRGGGAEHLEERRLARFVALSQQQMTKWLTKPLDDVDLRTGRASPLGGVRLEREGLARQVARLGCAIILAWGLSRWTSLSVSASTLVRSLVHIHPGPAD